jgi:hypothetical protein
MTAGREATRPTADAVGSCTLVWIDSREAKIVRWHDDEVLLERIASDVPAHHRATGHVRRDPAFGPGGGTVPRSSGEPKRLEHLARFVDRVAGRLDPADDLVILGPGTVRERLERQVDEADRHAARSRRIVCEPSARLTDRQLVTRVRHEAGADPARRTTGPYRWTGEPDLQASGRPRRTPRHLVQKPPSDVGVVEQEIAEAIAEAVGDTEPT